MGNRRKPRSASPLRAALAAKTSLKTFHDIATAEPDAIDTAVRKVQGAQQLQVATMLSPDPEVRAKADKALADAKAERDACFHRIWFRGLGPNEFDALVALHPPTDEQAAADHAWNPDTFEYALLEASALDSDGVTPAGLTAAEWETELADEEKWPRPERSRLILMVWAAQRQTMADSVPKD